MAEGIASYLGLHVQTSIPENDLLIFTSISKIDVAAE
jgi:hypothetical protein